MYQFKSDCQSCIWEQLAVQGIESKTIYFDEETNVKTVETRIAAGATIPRHFHTNANETVYVLSGDFIEDGETYGPGSYFAGKAGTAHGPHHSVGGCVVITHWIGGPVDFIQE